MAIDPDLRYATVDEFAEDLRRYIAGKPVKAHIGVGQRIRSVKRAYRRRFAAAAVIALIATSSTIAAFALYSARDAKRKNQELALISLASLEIGSFVKQATAHFNARETDQAIAMLQKAVVLAGSVPADNPLVRRQIYQAHHNLADYYFRLNRPEEAGKYCEIAIELSEAFQREEPDDLEWMRLGSYSRWLSGRAAYARSKWAAAIQHFEAVLTMRKNLAEREPQVRHRQVELADVHKWIGKAARKGDQLQRAVRHHSMACSILTVLLNAEPEMAGYAMRLSQSESMLGEAQMEYKTSYWDRRALESFQHARQRMAALQGTPDAEDHEKYVVELLTSIDQNISIVNRRLESSTSD